MPKAERRPKDAVAAPCRILPDYIFGATSDAIILPSPDSS